MISIVCPVYNEERNIRPLVRETAEIQSVLHEIELILVDDFSTDRTWNIIEECRRDFRFLAPIRLDRHTGQSGGLLRGLASARGDIIVTMDGDLQNNPADIPRLVEKAKTCDVVCGFRANRRDSWSRRVAGRVGNTVRNWFTQDGVRDTGCSLKAFHCKCIPDLPPLDGVHRFMPAYFRLNGRTLLEIPVDHRPRQHEQSKYTNWKRLPRTTRDLLGFLWYRSRYVGTTLQGLHE